MGIMGKKAADHEFYCVHCGRKALPICRTGKMREAGHLEKQFCFFCGSATNHAECIPGSGYDKDEFFREYNDGNFSAEGQRIIPFLKWSSRSEKEEELICDDEWLNIVPLREAN